MCHREPKIRDFGGGARLGKQNTVHTMVSERNEGLNGHGVIGSPIPML